MKPKRLLAILMSLAMVAGIAACGNSESSSGSNGGSAADTTAAAGDSTAADDSAAGDDAAAADDGELEDIAQIEIMFWTLNVIPSDVDMVEEAINEITREKINTEINLNILEMGNYVQQLNLIISGGEKMDLMVTLPGDSAHFNSMTSQNQLMDITDLLTEYAPELLETVPESWLAGTEIDGRIYSVTSMGDKATPLGFACRTDILEQTGIDPSTIENANDLEELFAAVLEVDSTITPVATGSKKILTAPYLIDADGNFVKYDAWATATTPLSALWTAMGQPFRTTTQDRYILTHPFVS